MDMFKDFCMPQGGGGDDEEGGGGGGSSDSGAILGLVQPLLGSSSVSMLIRSFRSPTHFLFTFNLNCSILVSNSKLFPH